MSLRVWVDVDGGKCGELSLDASEKRAVSALEGKSSQSGSRGIGDEGGETAAGVGPDEGACRDNRLARPVPTVGRAGGVRHAAMN